MVLKDLCVFVLWMKVASALDGLSVPPAIVVWIYNAFDNYFGIDSDSSAYLKGSCWQCPDSQFSLGYHPNLA